MLTGVGQGWPTRRAVEVARELALALAKAHREGIVHRDLKPANVMVDTSGGLVLMDFGLARWYDDLDSTFTPTGAVLGTPAYMPPEQAEGNVKAIGPRSDVYSLGVILYELLTGRRPFEGPMMKVLGMIAFVDPLPPSSFRPDLDPRLEAICLKAMAKKPEERHASMDEFAGALTAFLAEEAAPSPVVPPRQAEPHADQDFADSEDWSPRSPSKSRPRSTIRSWIAVAAAFAAFLFGIIIYVANDNGRIKIEVNDPNAVVFVDKKIVRIEGVGDPITLTAGKHDLSIKRGDVEVEAREFIVKRGDNEPLKITLELPPPPPVNSTPSPAVKVDSPPADVPKPTPPKVDDSLIINTLGMKLKLIPDGKFLMGSDASDPGARDDEKVNGKTHEVRITRPFYMGTTEVTVGQFRKFVEATNYKTEAERDGKGGYGWNEAKGIFEQDPKYTWRSPGFPQSDDHPVVNVSWNDAVAICEWLSKEEGQTYRLPTEAEWEYSCRAGQASRYSSGDDPETLATVGNVADGTLKARYPNLASGTMTAPDGFVFTAPVGRFRANDLGLFDMHGNVWEWCADSYDSDYYSRSPSADPMNSSGASYRVIRGGSWSFSPRDCRSALRFRYAPGFRSSFLGFRVARVRSGP